MSVAPASATDRCTGSARPLDVSTEPCDDATSSTLNGGSVGTASSNVPSSWKHESVSSMPVSVPTPAWGRTSSETRRDSRGTFGPILTGLTLPPAPRRRDRELDNENTEVEMTVETPTFVERAIADLAACHGG